MPRDGSGHSHNAEEAGHNIQHGAPQGNEVRGSTFFHLDHTPADPFSQQPTSSGVDRSGKAAPAPEPEAGEGIGSTGQAQVTGTTGSGKGPVESTVDEQAQKLSK